MNNATNSFSANNYVFQDAIYFFHRVHEIEGKKYIKWNETETYSDPIVLDYEGRKQLLNYTRDSNSKKYSYISKISLPCFNPNLSYSLSFFPLIPPYSNLNYLFKAHYDHPDPESNISKPYRYKKSKKGIVDDLFVQFINPQVILYFATCVLRILKLSKKNFDVMPPITAHHFHFSYTPTVSDIEKVICETAAIILTTERARSESSLLLAYMEFYKLKHCTEAEALIQLEKMFDRKEPTLLFTKSGIKPPKKIGVKYDPSLFADKKEEEAKIHIKAEELAEDGAGSYSSYCALEKKDFHGSYEASASGAKEGSVDESERSGEKRVNIWAEYLQRSKTTPITVDDDESSETDGEIEFVSKKRSSYFNEILSRSCPSSQNVSCVNYFSQRETNDEVSRSEIINDHQSLNGAIESMIRQREESNLPEQEDPIWSDYLKKSKYTPLKNKHKNLFIRSEVNRMTHSSQKSGTGNEFDNVNDEMCSLNEDVYVKYVKLKKGIRSCLKEPQEEAVGGLPLKKLVDRNCSAPQISSCDINQPPSETDQNCQHSQENIWTDYLKKKVRIHQASDQSFPSSQEDQNNYLSSQNEAYNYSFPSSQDSSTIMNQNTQSSQEDQNNYLSSQNEANNQSFPSSQESQSNYLSSQNESLQSSQDNSTLANQSFPSSQESQNYYLSSQNESYQSSQDNSTLANQSFPSSQESQNYYLSSQNESYQSSQDNSTLANQSFPSSQEDAYTNEANNSSNSIYPSSKDNIWTNYLKKRNSSPQITARSEPSSQIEAAYGDDSIWNNYLKQKNLSPKPSMKLMMIKSEPKLSLTPDHHDIRRTTLNRANIAPLAPLFDSSSSTSHFDSDSSFSFDDVSGDLSYIEDDEKRFGGYYIVRKKEPQFFYQKFIEMAESSHSFDNFDDLPDFMHDVLRDDFYERKLEKLQALNSNCPSPSHHSTFKVLLSNTEKYFRIKYRRYFHHWLNRYAQDIQYRLDYQM